MSFATSLFRDEGGQAEPVLLRDQPGFRSAAAAAHFANPRNDFWRLLADADRPEHGLQERRLGETRLFVLPSTSPANAAVPYEERLRWFSALRAELPD
jgi:G:T/U-mismatch repair DNA glycosylase